MEAFGAAFAPLGQVFRAVAMVADEVQAQPLDSNLVSEQVMETVLSKWQEKATTTSASDLTMYVYTRLHKRRTPPTPPLLVPAWLRPSFSPACTVPVARYHILVHTFPSLVVFCHTTKAYFIFYIFFDVIFPILLFC